MLTAPFAATADPLTEIEAVQIALARADRAGRWPAMTKAFELEAKAARFGANPSVQIGYAQVFGGVGEAEQSLGLSQRVDLSDRRGAQAMSAHFRAEQSKAESSLSRVSRAYQTRVTYFKVVRQQARHRALREWRDQLQKAMKTQAQREASGDSAPYATRRLARELRAANAELAAAKALRGASWRELGVLIGPRVHPRWPYVAGPLLPSLPASRPMVDPAAEVLKMQANAARAVADAADAIRLPAFEVSAGYRGLRGEETGHGFSVGLSMPLAVVDDGRARAAAARSHARQFEAARETRIGERALRLASAQALATELIAVAQNYQQNTARLGPPLLETAVTAWRGGELSLLELLDAERSASADTLRAIELCWQARAAQLKLDHIRGRIQ